MIKKLLLSLILLLVSLPVQAASVPQLAAGVGRDIDRQLTERFGLGDESSKGFTLMVTSPANLNNLESSSPLARQFQEELSKSLVQQGYTLQELRKGSEILFDPAQGEFLLTRRVDLVQEEMPESAGILVGTYTLSSKNVRFNIRIIETGSLTVLAMANVTIPLSSEIKSLLREHNSLGGISSFTPSVYTTLP